MGLFEVIGEYIMLYHNVKEIKKFAFTPNVNLYHVTKSVYVAIPIGVFIFLTKQLRCNAVVLHFFYMSMISALALRN